MIKKIPTTEEEHSEFSKKLNGISYVEQFAKAGAELLKKTNRPNVITVAEFAPFIELYRYDKKRYESDPQYKNYLRNLGIRFKNELSINFYEVTFVVESLENPVEVYFLDRIWTRIKSDVTDVSASARSKVPSSLPVTADVSREDLLIRASIGDLMAANNTPAQQSNFTRVAMESALIQKYFTERNLSPDKRPEELGGTVNSGSPQSASDQLSEMTTFLDDDDD